MRRVKFVLLTALILLSGAALSGLAAWKVVSPPEGEIVSAGVVSVPSVLGQTADEVLFYPWTVYDMQALSPISEEDLAEYGSGGPFDSFAAIAAMDALGPAFDMEQLVRAQQVYHGKGLGAGQIELRYVKDFPASLGDEPVLLSYAQSGYNPTSVSWLMHPAREEPISDEREREALDKVRDDLAGLIWYGVMAQAQGYHSDLTAFLEGFGRALDGLPMFSEWLQEWMELMSYQYTGGFGGLPVVEEGTPGGAAPPGGQEEWQEPPPCSLEELLAMGQGEFVDIQFISTHRQVVVLFSLDSAASIGVYYDIQLGRYSGLGMSR